MSQGDGRVEPPGEFEVAGWQVYPRLNRVSRGETTEQVEPKVMQVLVHLTGRAGEPVTREDLLETVWAGTVVTDDVLTRSVSELRKLFGDDPRRPSVIETIQKVGYRLIAPVQFDHARLDHARLDHAGDSSPRSFTFELTPSAPAPPAVASPRGIDWRWPLAAFLLLVAGWAGWALFRPDAGPVSPRPLEVRPLTTFPGREFGAALSPDGEHVAFLRNRDGDGSLDLYVAPVETMSPLRLTETAETEWSPAWSPDGHTLAFVRLDRAGCGVFVVPALGGPERRLAACTPGAYASLDWSPDGRLLALAGQLDEEGRSRIVFLDAATGERLRTLPPAPGRAWDDAPRFSPDGRRLAFRRYAGEGMQDLYVAALPAGEARRVTTDERGVNGLAWSPDGRDLLFASNRSGDYGLWRVPAGGGEPAWLGAGHGGVRPAAARQGRRFVYERWETDSNIYRRGRDGATVSVASSTRMDFYPHVSPDGRRLVFVSDRTGAYEVWSSDVDGADARRFTEEGYTYASLPRWSPDGRRVVFAAHREGVADLFVLDAPGRSPRRLTSHDGEEVAPSWSTDGRWIYFGSDRGGGWDVWKVPAGGGEAVQVTRGGGYVARESADGDRLYFTRRGEDGLWRLSLSEGGAAPEREPERVLGGLLRYDPYNWSLHAGAVYYFDRSRLPEVAIARHDLASGRVTEVAALGRVMTEGGFAVTPDEQTYLYIQVDRAEADLMLGEW